MTYLALSWSISRGRDTYGYNICRLDDTSAHKRYRCSGGGYDMIGTVFGDWLADRYQDHLLLFCKLKLDEAAELYGLYMSASSKGAHGLERISLDGACGIESMLRIAEAIGLEVKRVGDRKGRTIGFSVGEKILWSI